MSVQETQETRKIQIETDGRYLKVDVPAGGKWNIDTTFRHVTVWGEDGNMIAWFAEVTSVQIVADGPAYQVVPGDAP